MSIDDFFNSKPWQAVWQAFARTFIMLGLPLLAWGMDDMAGFFSNPVRAGLALVAVTQALFHAWLVLRIPERPEREQQHDLEHWHFSLLELLFIVAAFGDRRNILTWSEIPTLRWVGLGVYLLAVICSTWANLTWVNHLREKADAAYNNPVLLSKGPFQWVRYPTLFVIIFYGLGFALAYRSWVGLIFMIPLIGIIIRRMNLWEEENAIRYPKVWALRCQSSKRIIPFLF